MMKIFRISGWMALCALTATPADADSSRWEITGAASLAAADGNSESLSYSLQLMATHAAEDRETRLGLDHFYAEKGSLESANSLKFHEQLSFDLNEDWYFSQYGSAMNDQVADVDYRVDGSALLGWRMLNTERCKLSIEAGPGHAWEKQAGRMADYMTARLAQRFEFKLSGDTRLWQSFGWTPRVDDLSDSLIEFDLGLENRITRRVAMRTFLRHRIDGSPSAGSGREDTALMLGLSYDLAGGGDESAGGGSDLTTALLGTALAAGDEDWESTAALGLSLNKGNADRTGLKFDWDSEFTSDERDFIWELEYQFAEEDDQTSTDRLNSHLQTNHYLDGPFYVGASAGYLRDDLADIEYRVTPSLHVGYALIKNERTRLAFEAGPTLTFEQTGDGSGSYASQRIAERFKHRFSDKLSLKQSVVALAEYEDPEHYTLAGKLALDTKLNSHLLWRWELESRYENLPVDGRDHHDLLLSSSIGIKF